MISLEQIKDEPIDPANIKINNVEIDLERVKPEPVHAETGPKKTCQYCEKTFSNDYIMKLHLRVHIAGRIFNCDWCPMKFTLEEDLRSHKAVHKSEFKFECVRCELFFYDWKGYRSHIWKHGNHRPFKCDSCPKAFDQANALNHHKAAHRNLRIKRNVSSRDNAVVRRVCNLCNLSCPSEKSFEEHAAKHEENLQLECKVCAGHFTKITHYLRHRETAHIHKCGECKLAFISRYLLQSHSSVHIVSNHQCERCLKLFKSAPKLKSHSKSCSMRKVKVCK